MDNVEFNKVCADIMGFDVLWSGICKQTHSNWDPYNDMSQLGKVLTRLYGDEMVTVYFGYMNTLEESMRNKIIERE